MATTKLIETLLLSSKNWLQHGSAKLTHNWLSTDDKLGILMDQRQNENFTMLCAATLQKDKID